MMKQLILAIIFFSVLINSAFAVFKPVEGLDSAQIKRVAVSNINESLLYIASDNSLYKSQDEEKSIKKVAVFKDEEVGHIFFDPYLADTIYIATSRHFYQMKDDLKELFASNDDYIINTAKKYRGVFYLGTSQGAYYAREDLLKWKKLKGLNDYSIFDIDSADGVIYFATNFGVYRLKEQDNVQRLFVMRASDDDGEESLTARTIDVDIFENKRIWLGTNRGLFISENKGETWNKFFVEGLDNLYINCLIQTKLQENVIYIGSRQGLFLVDIERKSSKQIFEGLYSSWINWIEINSEGEIFVATNKGMFKNNYFSPSSQDSKLEIFSEAEPSISEIQQAALRYNEIHPEKIRHWRTRLKFRALFPNINLDYDKSIYGSSSGAFAVGPRDWGLSFSWNVGDLIWNTYEDDIDTRSRLNTQLRLDILDEINRVYFERLRFKKEIVDSDLSQEGHFKNELRLQELTAILDGYTGGFFSKRVKKLSDR